MEYSGVASMVLLVVVLSFHFSSRASLLVQATVTCQSPLHSSCQRSSHQCVADNRDQCLPPSNMAPIIDPDSRVRECPSIREKCKMDSNTSTSNATFTSILLNNVSAPVVSLNPKYYSVNVSWTLSTSSDFGGYEVRLAEVINGRERSPKRCVCIPNSNVLNFDFINLKYKSISSALRVKVLPYPLPPTGSLSPAQIQIASPNGCADTFIGNTVCNTRYYDAPVNLRVLSSICNGTKRMEISWDPPSNAPEPPMYYVYINIIDEYSSTHIFTVHNATSMIVRNLNASLDYWAQVQAYSRCSGLGNLLEHDRELGCGQRLWPLEPENIVECPTSIATFSTPQPTSELPTSVTLISDNSPTTETGKKRSSLLFLVCIPVVSILIVVVAISLCILKHYCVIGRDDVIPKNTGLENQQLLIFYCSTTTPKNTSYIQKHVICKLLPYFNILTPNNFSRGDVSTWLEEAVQASKAVLLVCNEELCLEWEMEGRNPSLNALRHLISAAVSSNIIDKFGIIVTRESQKDECIPDNYYLQLMPVFLMSKGKHEVDAIYKFVNRVKPFQFSTGSTPTTEGPAHVAICSVE